MVYKITETQRIFLDTLVITLLIFLLGFFIGFSIESHRANTIQENAQNNEISALDLKLQDYYYQTLSRETCSIAIEQNFNFADKLYTEGLSLEKYEEANQITPSLLLDKKRYVLLKTELWLNTILLKQKCDPNLNTVVYFYYNFPPSDLVKNQQEIISNILQGVKEKEGNRLVLLPIAGDLDLDSVTLQKDAYNVTSLPSVLINEKQLLVGFHTEDEIISYLNTNSTIISQSNNT